MAPSEFIASKLRSIPWSVMSRINATLTLTFELVSAPGHMNTRYLGPHLNPAFQSIHLFGLSSKNMRYMMNYLSFTSYSGWKKIQLIEKWKEKEKLKHKKETIEKFDGNHPPSHLPPLHSIVYKAEAPVDLFCVFGCVAVKLLLCSPCGENTENRGSTAPQRTAHALTHT